MESDSGLESAVEACENETDITEGYDGRIIALDYSGDDNYQERRTETEESNKKENHKPLSGKTKNKSIELSDIMGSSARFAEYYSEHGKEEAHNGKGTNKASAAIIYNKETGEFYFELKPLTYSLAPGKLALVGGKVEHFDKDSLAALIREIGEEVVNKKAQEILIGKVNQLGSHYHTIVEVVHGVKYETDIFLINVDSVKEWNIVKNSSLAEGQSQVLTWQETQRRFGDFAFNYDEPLRKLINELNRSNLHSKAHEFHMPIIYNGNYNSKTNISCITLPSSYNESIAMRLAA